MTSEPRQTRSRAEVTFFRDAAAFRAWLASHHDDTRELWVGFYNKGSNTPSVTYREAVEEALCFGWIDGLRLKVDAEVYTNRFTPRKAGSNWSAINLKRIEALTTEGRMQPPGIEAYERRPPGRSYSYEGLALSAEQEASIKRSHGAWAFFQAQPPWYQRIAMAWVQDAKQEQTRERRLERLISDSEAGEWTGPLRGSRSRRRESPGNQT
jgi:uncharacterized protein YdeI (YjbR/CyaY-like superfamily)